MPKKVKEVLSKERIQVEETLRLFSKLQYDKVQALLKIIGTMHLIISTSAIESRQQKRSMLFQEVATKIDKTTKADELMKNLEDLWKI